MEKAYKDYIESKLMVPNVEHTLLIWSSNKKSNSRRTLAVEILLWLQYIYSNTKYYSKGTLTAAGKSLAAGTGSHVAG